MTGRNSLTETAINLRFIDCLIRFKVLLPPNFTRYLAWGYPDDSFRICSLIGDKVLQVFEMVTSSQVLCAAAPNSSTIVTAGMTGVVKVWQVRSEIITPVFPHRCSNVMAEG